MVRTRSQARAKNHNGASGMNVASRPTYYGDENDSIDESEATEEDSDDEYKPRTDSRRVTPRVTKHHEGGGEDEEEKNEIPQTPGSMQASEQDYTPPRDPNQTATYHDTAGEEAAPQERPSDERFFFEDELRLGPPSFIDLTRLEFFQTFPHDPAATLCSRHFLQLAQSWHMRRQGHTENMIYDLNQEFPCSGVGSLLNFSRDREVLGQAVWDEPWRRMELAEFMRSLQQLLDWAEAELREQRRSAISGTGIPPRCELENCGALSCGYCLAMTNAEVNLYEAIREARAKSGHGAWQDGDAAAFEEHQRRRIDALDLEDARSGRRDRDEIDMASAYLLDF
ncbi:hypothetical protein Trco_008273 [Trichoderma cornu-damae]|uniref:Uncharacterized protein n=1 Tax=Trichoderma cornu-damae TaxID=654480 RepID=A0A9P8QID3_9HYPO|nr:hypothetical protein Trco_008273 [Trichoderma cornu-damae]